jgi:hypothetical protein
MPQALLFEQVSEAARGLFGVVLRRALYSRDYVVWLALAVRTRVVVVVVTPLVLVVVAALLVLALAATVRASGVRLCSLRVPKSRRFIRVSRVFEFEKV